VTLVVIKVFIHLDDFFKNREDLQRLISGGYVSDDEIGKRPLSKLVKDISNELGLL